jgi:hypothetical protein
VGGQQAVPHSIDVLFAPPVVTGLTALDAASDGNSACPGVCVRDGGGGWPPLKRLTNAFPVCPVRLRCRSWSERCCFS